MVVLAKTQKTKEKTDEARCLDLAACSIEMVDASRDMAVRIGLLGFASTASRHEYLNEDQWAADKNRLREQALALSILGKRVYAGQVLPDSLLYVLCQDRINQTVTAPDDATASRFFERVFAARLAQIGADIENTSEAYRRSLGVGDAAAQPEEQSSLDKAIKPLLTTEQMKFGARLAGTAILVIVIIVFLNLPGDTQTLVAALVVVCQVNLGKSHERLRFRLAGILTGGAYGLLVYMLMALLPYFSLYLLVMALGLLLFGYYAARFDLHNYLWAQANLMLATTMVTTEGPISELEGGALRLFGAVVGCSLALGISHYVFPVDPQRILRADVAKGLRRTGGFMDALVMTSDQSEKAQQDALAAVTEALLSGREDEGFVRLLMRRDHDVGILFDRLEALSEIRLDLATISETYRCLETPASRLFIAASLAPLRQQLVNNLDRLSQATEEAADLIIGHSPDDLMEPLQNYRQTASARLRQDASLAPDRERLEALFNSVEVVIFKVWRMGRAVRV